MAADAYHRRRVIFCERLPTLLFYYGTYDTLSMVPYTLSEFRDPCCPRAKSGFRRKYYF